MIVVWGWRKGRGGRRARGKLMVKPLNHPLSITGNINLQPRPTAVVASAPVPLGATAIPTLRINKGTYNRSRIAPPVSRL